jgi:pimeloyl-ACP methyl ester carboxylesterase
MPARLYQERITHGGAVPARWLVLTHGIYGAGSNWRSIARKLTEQRPEWGVALVDLRQHGRSEPGEPPHTVAACAEDLRGAVTELGAVGPVGALAGHSFGGKVVLAARGLLPELPQTWILDANPGRLRAADPARGPERNSMVLRLLELMERSPRHWQHRDDFVALVTGDGHDLAIARWLAMNLVPDPAGGLVLRLDVTALRAMLADYYAVDLWGALDAPGGEVELVVAETASTFGAADRARLGSAPPHVHVHYLAAGHWVHIDAPAAVVELFAARLA